LEAALIEKSAETREEENWRGKEEGERPICPELQNTTCFARKAYAKFTKEQLEENQTEKNLRDPVRTVEQVFSPLDEKLELQPGSLTPLQQSHLEHFATVVSFERAAKFLMQHHGVCVSGSTSRRQTEAIGACAEVVQNKEAKARVTAR